MNNTIQAALALLCLSAVSLLTGCAARIDGTRGAGISIESRTLSPKPPDSAGVNLQMNQRIVADGRILLLGRMVTPDGLVFFSQRETRMDGTPIVWWQEGFWSERWNHLETRYSSTSTEQHINEQINKSDLPDRMFIDPTVLWFWHTHPKLNESVVVTNLSQNVIQTSRIRYTYEGDEKLTLAGRTVNLHRVREDPVGVEGVHTIWWYDDRGMGVKRYHKTTQHEYNEELVAWN